MFACIDCAVAASAKYALLLFVLGDRARACALAHAHMVSIFFDEEGQYLFFIFLLFFLQEKQRANLRRSRLCLCARKQGTKKPKGRRNPNTAAKRQKEGNKGQLAPRVCITIARL
nr:hypothetical protein [Pandoravirus massiliensis]